ncbi:MAG: hypothetical protein WBA73_15200 [Devosia sp.]
MLSDAKLVALYVQKAGKLLDTQLFTAIANVEKLPSKSWADPAIVELQTAFTKTMHALSPITVQDLTGRRAPFSDSRLLAAFSFLFIIAIIAMIVAAGWLTLQYNQGRALMLSIEELQEADAESRISDLVREILVNERSRVVQGTDVLNEAPSADDGNSGPDPVAPPGQMMDSLVEAVAAETYLRKLQEMRTLDAEAFLTAELAKEFINRNVDVADFLTWGHIFVTDKAEDDASADQNASNLVGAGDGTTASFTTVTDGPAELTAVAVAGALPVDDTGGDTTETPVLAPSPSESAQIPLAQLPQQSDPCELGQDEVASLHSGNPFSKTEIGSLISAHFTDGIQVTCLGRMKYHIFDFPEFELVADRLRYTVNIYGLWLLPALYGALGAALFYLRMVLDPLQPSPQFRRVIHRVTVGGFAGVIIAWIWAPSAQISGEFQNIGVNLFFVAFLVGYSIDIFFAVLDRLVVSVTASVGRIGTAQASP